MYRPRTVYRGKERSGRIATLIVVIAAALILLAAWMFYDLQRYMVYDKDGARLVMPGDAAAEPLSAKEEGDGTAAVELTDVEIIVEQADYSALPDRDVSDLTPLHARQFSGAALTGTALSNLATGGAGDYDALVLDLKPESGVLAYHSGVGFADSYDLNGTLELGDYVGALKERGLYLVARLNCLADAALATRNAPIGLKDADGRVYTTSGKAWLDPYQEGTRAYLAALMEELADMGFDEILLDGLALPDLDGGYRFSAAMTGETDAVDAVSSLALYLSGTAETLGVRVSAVAEERGQDHVLFFKVFDRAAYAAGANLRAALEEALGAESGTRLVPITAGSAPGSGSYIVR